MEFPTFLDLSNPEKVFLPLIQIPEEEGAKRMALWSKED